MLWPEISIFIGDIGCNNYLPSKIHLLHLTESKTPVHRIVHTQLNIAELMQSSALFTGLSQAFLTVVLGPGEQPH